ncbi:MAG: putative dehydrogenase [Planctomycetota bacterium]|nr:putative dehydrogenase [Planctomycetota bacterium]
MDANCSNTDRLGVLVVGVGFLGRQRASASRIARHTHLVAVTDADASLARRVAEELGVAAVPTVDEGLGLDKVDVVVVATPHADHEEVVRRALDAGKHVLCEKPLAIDPDECRDLAHRADVAGLRLGTGFNHRFYSPVREALALVSSWMIGRVESVRLTIGHSATPEFLAGWHADRAVSGGGTLMDNGVHGCDLARRFLGEVVAAKGYTRDAIGLPFGIESEAFALFRNHERGVAEVRSSWTLEAGYLTIEVRGSAGHVKLETAPWRLSGRLADGSSLDRRYIAERLLEKVHRRRFGCERSLVDEMEDFATLDPDHPRASASGWDGARATEMADAVYRAAASGEEVALTPPIVRSPSQQATLQASRLA